MHNDCWLSSLLHGLDSVHCCFYSEPHLPAVWMVIVVSFHSHHLCSIMWSVANHRCTCCILTGRICDSEMTATIVGFRRVEWTSRGHQFSLFWIHVVWSHLCVSWIMVCCIYMCSCAVFFCGCLWKQVSFKTCASAPLGLSLWLLSRLQGGKM